MHVFPRFFCWITTPLTWLNSQDQVAKADGISFWSELCFNSWEDKVYFLGHNSKQKQKSMSKQKQF
jgi:hypothetical protein